MKHRLIAGTINHWPDGDGWQNWTLDVSDRPVWSSDLSMAVAPDFVADLTGGLPDFRDEMFDEVRVHHVLEHLSFDGTRAAAGAIWRILRPLGTLDVEVPDLDGIAQAYVAGELDFDGAQQWLYGEQLPNHLPGDSHRVAWTEAELRRVLTDAEFVVGPRLAEGLAIRFIATKPPGPAA